MSVKIRQANSNDLSAIIKMDKEIFGQYGGEEDPEIITARLEVFPAGCFILEEVAEIKNEIENKNENELKAKNRKVPQIVGYITTEKWLKVREPALNEDPHKTHCPNGSVLNITTLAIKSAFRGRSYGGEALKWLEQFCKFENCGEIVLETANARHFYAKHGYKLVGERNERGYPLYIMLKKLTSLSQLGD